LYPYDIKELTPSARVHCALVLDINNNTCQEKLHHTGDFFHESSYRPIYNGFKGKADEGKDSSHQNVNDIVIPQIDGTEDETTTNDNKQPTEARWSGKGQQDVDERHHSVSTGHAVTIHDQGGIHSSDGNTSANVDNVS
jgi:hypothetical protein